MNQYDHYLNYLGIVRWMKRGYTAPSTIKLVICLEEQACGLEKNLLDNMIRTLPIETTQIAICIGESALDEKQLSDVWCFYFGISPSHNPKNEHVFVQPNLKTIIQDPSLKRSVWSIMCNLK